MSTREAKTTVAPATSIMFSKAINTKPTKIFTTNKNQSKNKTYVEKLPNNYVSNTFSTLCHRYHNVYRRKHGSPDLELDNQLNSEAQMYIV